MTSAELQLALAGLGIVGAMMVGLLLAGLRGLWRLAQILQEDRDATQANTAAIKQLTVRVDRIDRPAAARGRRSGRA